MPGSGETMTNRHSSRPLGLRIEDQGGDTPQCGNAETEKSRESESTGSLPGARESFTCHAHADLWMWSCRLYGFQPLAGPSACRPFWSWGLGGLSPVPDGERREVLESRRSGFESQLYDPWHATSLLSRPMPVVVSVSQSCSCLSI